MIETFVGRTDPTRALHNSWVCDRHYDNATDFTFR